MTPEQDLPVHTQALSPDRIEKLCVDKGMRMTEQRRVIARVLSTSVDHPDVEELYRRSSAVDPHISIATVYRTVRLLEDAGIIARHDFRDVNGTHRSRYEEATGEHHHHLIDLKSGQVIEFVDEEIEEMKKAIARRLGYKLVECRLGALRRAVGREGELSLSSPPTAGSAGALKRLHIKTYGCQMNVYDSERMADVLRPLGYGMTDSPDEADLVVLNTCHIREKAAEKVYSELGRLKAIRAERLEAGLPRSTIVVAGCVAQAAGAEIMTRQPAVDLVVGPQAYHQLPELIARASRARGERLAADFAAQDKFDRLAGRSVR